MGQNCEKTIGMSLDSVKYADKIIYLDGGSSDKTISIVSNFHDSNGMHVEILSNSFDKDNPNMISIQRNFYLDYLKKNHYGAWTLVIDADEVLDNGGIDKLRKYTEYDISTIYSIKMRHLMYTLSYEDAAQEIHFVPNRFFKVANTLSYPAGEHTILNGEFGEGRIVDTQIWHLAYLGGAWDVKKRYDQQIERNSGYPKEFLNQWNKAHMTGKYPIKELNPSELPDNILNNFGLSKDELYFTDRTNIEIKHFQFVKQWNEKLKPTFVADFGCGVGPYLYAWEMTGVTCEGYELSRYAIENKICNAPIYRMDLNVKNDFSDTCKYDLVTAIDVLEHLEYDKVDSAIDTLIDASNKYILTSIPYKGTPNCENDPTHIIKESREYWVDKFTTQGLKEVEVPADWIFKEQLLLFEK